MYADLMFKPSEDSGELPAFDFEKIISIIMRLRPGTKVSALDFASFQMRVSKNYETFEKHLKCVEKMTTAFTDKEMGKDTENKPEQEADDMITKEPSRISLTPFLENSSDLEILNELQRRLGMGSVSTPSLSQGALDSMPPKIADAFQSHLPGLPDTQAWSKETYTC